MSVTVVYRTEPAASAVAVTPSDSTVVNCRALYVGTGGNVAVLMANDTVVATFSNVPSGTVLPISVQKVMAATTASNILALN